MPTVTASTNESKRESILTIASELFSRQDYASVVMDDIAASCGVAKGTLYNYFGSKDALYGEVITNRLQHLVAALSDSCSQRDDTRLNIRRVAVHVMSFMLKYPAFFRIWKREEGWVCGETDHAWCRLREELHEILIGILQQGIEAGLIRPIKPEVAAAQMFGAIDGAVYRCIGVSITSSTMDRERDALDEFIWRAVASENTV
jgi:AcrR family transcriptional regulator